MMIQLEPRMDTKEHELRPRQRKRIPEATMLRMLMNAARLDWQDSRFSAGLVLATLALAFWPLNVVSGAEPATVDFNRDIRPILSDHCFECHGPDAEQRQAELRLDTQAGLFRKTDKYSSVVPGKAGQSELFRRISSVDPDERMPPSDSGRNLTAAQISAIKQWSESGAERQQHWSFVTPTRPETPSVSTGDWVKNPIDGFILARLDRDGFKPSAAADRRTLLRRVSFDLTGLPPTPEELHDFLKDDSPEAYERVVDRLLKSPRYAERMTIRWLDAARYADTNGYQTDGPRDMWRWRDWVLEAFHKNMPFDQFTIEQLAGDLLPDATLDQKIATGFNRNHRGNAEGGIVPEEFQVEYVVDRIDTTFTVWQGLTMSCARCHSHKFDPLSQKEYYQLFSCFNNIPENGRALKEGNSPPWILAPTREHVMQRAALEHRQAGAERKYRQIWDEFLDKDPLAIPFRTLDPEEVNRQGLGNWTVTDGLAVEFDFESRDAVKERLVSGKSEPSNLNESPLEKGIIGQCVSLTDGQSLELTSEESKPAKFGYFDSFSIGAWVKLPKQLRPRPPGTKLDVDLTGTILSKMVHVDRGAGWNLHVTERGHLQLNLVKRWLDDSLRVETLDQLPTGKWIHVFATYDGSRVSSGINVYVNGRLAKHKANLDGINQSFGSDDPVRIGTGNSNFNGAIDEVRIYNRVLDLREVRSLAVPLSIAELLKPKNAERQLTTKGALFFVEAGGPENIRSSYRQLQAVTRALDKFNRDIPTLMIMQEMETPRETHVLLRGQYDRPGERVTFGTPAALPPLPDDAPTNRLGLARWLVSRDNPLTARVIVNRFWRDIFGTGIVKTTEDFGVQSERPSHPELLDWLAVEFMESGWNVKQLIKTIVMSNTYQQISRVRKPENGGLANDPKNRLLARGPRGRLSAEMIRDQALMASGMLTEKLGGPSVRPYQPEGLLKDIASDTDYVQDHGPDLYRRSIYTYWKRTVAPPMMTNFDAAGREVCEVRQSRTNTPLQALNLLNDVTFVEAARVLAQNMLALATGHDDPACLTQIFERVLGRPPGQLEQRILLESLAHHRQRFSDDKTGANALIEAGEWPVNADLAPAELAAWTTLCSTIFNLDEAVTKE
jgi:mono/diheme cytochrome c family protein